MTALRCQGHIDLQCLIDSLTGSISQLNDLASAAANLIAEDQDAQDWAILSSNGCTKQHSGKKCLHQ